MVSLLSYHIYLFFNKCEYFLKRTHDLEITLKVSALAAASHESKFTFTALKGKDILVFL